MLSTSTSQGRSAWQGERVAFTGRLGSLTRSQARSVVVDRGGQFAWDVTRYTTVLVVGGSGLPLNPKGRLTRKLERGRWLQRQGVSVVLLNEHEFLQRSGLAPADSDRQLFVLADVEQMTQLSRDRIRRLIDAELIKPSAWEQGVPYFEFRRHPTVAGYSTMPGEAVFAGRHCGGAFAVSVTWYREPMHR